jgi:hypothetical protein
VKALNSSTYSFSVCSKKKKGDQIADDEDDNDAVRTSASQDRVTATLCTEELFLIIQYI